MTIALRDLTDLDPTAVAQNLAETVARLQEDNPALDVRRGVLHDLLAYYHSLLDTQRQANINDYLAARSLNQIQQDPTLADPSLVDDVLSNFGLFRKGGSRAVGEVAIVVSDDTTLTLASGYSFAAAGQSFVTDRVYTAKKEAAQINNAGDRLLAPTADGTWLFTVNVIAVAEGAAGQLPKDTLVIPDVLPANYVTSYAAGGFTGGRAAETNEELLARLQEGVACKAPSNRVNMAAMLRQIDEFSRVVAMSIIGCGDAEMRRDRHWIFPVGGGGRVDWYVRGEERLEKKLLVLEATCLAKDALTDTSTWQVEVTRDSAPGFYELTNVRRLGATNVLGGFDILAETRALDTTELDWAPDVIDLVEGDYTRYVTAVLTFTDGGSGQDAFDVGDTAEYQVEARCVPLVGEIQDTLSLPEVRSRAADVLVRAPVPCFVAVGFTVYKTSGQPDPDLDAVREALAGVINRTGFTGRLYASTLQAAAAGLLTDGQRAGGIDMLGRIRYPGGSYRYVNDRSILEVPDEPAAGVSARTVQFFADPADIGVSVATGPA